MFDTERTAQPQANDTDCVSEELMATIALLVQTRLAQQGHARDSHVSSVLLPTPGNDALVCPAPSLA